MGGAVMAEVVTLPECPPEVRARTRASGNRSLAKLVVRTELLRELDAGLTEGLFERCMVGGDGVVHRRLVGLDGLSRGQVERLVEAGASRAVRNLARARLRAGRYLG